MISGRLRREVLREEKKRRGSLGLPATWPASRCWVERASAYRLTLARAAFRALAHIGALFTEDSREVSRRLPPMARTDESATRIDAWPCLTIRFHA